MFGAFSGDLLRGRYVRPRSKIDSVQTPARWIPPYASIINDRPKVECVVSKKLSAVHVFLRDKTGSYPVCTLPHTEKHTISNRKSAATFLPLLSLFTQVRHSISLAVHPVSTSLSRRGPSVRA